MLQRCISFLVVFLLMFCGRNFAQTKTDVSTLLSTSKHSYTKSIFAVSKYKMPQTKNFGYNDRSGEKKIVSLRILSPNYSTTHLGFFCQKELQLDKITVVPIRFRLGSLAYVNYLEQKPNAINPQR